MIRSSHILALAFACPVALAAIALQPSTAAACKCAVRPLEERVNDSTHVFEAEITSIDPHEGSDPNYTLVARLKVLRSFRGTTYASDELRTASSGAACGVYFEAGKRYLIFASLREDGGAAPELWTTSCAGTQPVELAEADLAALGEGSAPVVPPAPPPATDAPAASAPTDPEAQGGCASCTVGGRRQRPARNAAVALCVALSASLLRRRSRARHAA